jgi:putative ABC transport system permease protein
MYQNLRFVLRRLLRQKLTTSLHVIGLTLGITVCLLIGVFIQYELSFDTYHQQTDKIYRLNTVWVEFGKKDFHFSTPFPLAEQIRKDIPVIEHVIGIHHPFQSIIQVTPERRFKQDHVMMTDPDFLDVFDVDVIAGNAYETLRKPYQAVLTQSTAKKFFGNDNPIGKTFTYNDSFPITVGSVIRDMPPNTHLPAAMLLSLSDKGTYLQTSTNHYGSVSGGSTFVVLPDGKKAKAALSAGLKSIYDRFLHNQPWMQKDSHVEIDIQPLRSVHFDSKYAGGGEWVKAINVQWLWFFGAVGLSVLLLACINFINLTTAQALSRAREIGVRKSIGAGRFQLIRQFLGEAFLLVLFAGVLSIMIAKMSLPAINELTGKQISFPLLGSPVVMLALLGGLVLTALLAGLYPAWVITRFQPATVLKSGQPGTSPGSAFLRKGLVVAQFSISVCLLIALLLIGKQMNFLRKKNLGFDKENIVIVPLPADNGSDKKRLFAAALDNVPAIKSSSFSTSPPSGGENTHWGTLMSLVGRDDPDRKGVTTIMADENFCQLYNLRLKAGRFLVAADTTAVSESIPEGQRYPKCIVNEKLVAELGFPNAEAALGKRFWIGMDNWKAEITGVVANFNIGSLHNDFRPTLITQYLPYTDKTNIKIEAGADIPLAIANIQSAFKAIYPSGIFEYNFLDQQLDALYKSEVRLFTLFRIFSILAMVISCLGLWGLITFAAQQRVKEIGVRKVLGASVGNLMALLTKDFILLVCIAIAIAAPLAYMGVSRWLEDFAFRIQIGWSVFIVAGVAAIAIALVTVSFQAIRAAVANPVDSLRAE